MAGLLEKRKSLHRELEHKDRQNGELESQIRQMHSLSNIGMVWAMVAHEMNNILSPLANYARLSLQHPDDKELMHKALQKTVKNSDRASKIMKSVLALASGKPQEKKEHNLKTLVDEVFACLARDLSKDKINVVLEIPEEMTIRAEGTCIQQVLMNLILNARKALLPNGGSLRIAASKDTDSVRIEVADSGCGIEPENLKEIFRPFFTNSNSRVKSQQAGTGLGLAFCKKVIEEHDGMISVESQVGRGTTFKVILPAH